LRTLLFVSTTRLVLRTMLRLGMPGLFLMSALDSSFLVLPFGNDLLLIALVSSNRESLIWIAYVLISAVGSVVGVRDQELVDEVALAAHHLDAVVAGLARQLGAAHERADLALDAGRVQRARRERRDRALDARRCDAQRRIAVAAGVQDLQRDLAAFGVHRVSHLPMAARRTAGRQRARERLGPTLDVGRIAAGDDAAVLAVNVAVLGVASRAIWSQSELPITSATRCSANAPVHSIETINITARRRMPR